MNPNPIIPVILCGGSGTRLWPLSRKSFPKQFLSFDAEENNSLIQNTYKRLSNIKNIKSPIIICNEEHRFIVAEQMKEINVKPHSILLEPFGRNTAPAITLAALESLNKDSDPIILVLSSDHIIDNVEIFERVVEKAIKYSLEDKLVTFGVIPTSPETGYGYIKADSPFDNSRIEGKRIDQFLEKPNYETAKRLIKDKKFTWNSGIFMFKSKKILDEIKTFTPNIYNICEKAMQEKIIDLDFQRIDKDIFEGCPNISIDIAVMEKTSLGIVLPLDAGWCDIGSWNSVWNYSKKDKNNNFIKGNIIETDSSNCLFRSESRLVVGMGLKNLIVIETSDAILIADKSYSERVKNIVQELKDKDIAAGLEHKKIYRPWGFYVSIVEDTRWQVKMINVKPGEKLSLQKHHHRAEHWVVVNGTAKVEVNHEEMILCENESTFIPLGSIHRLSNPGKINLSLIEIQSGSYLGEDDIERFEDNYGRVLKDNY